MRIGAPPADGQSQNHRDGHCEAGVSCYEVLVEDSRLWIVSTPLELDATRNKIREGMEQHAPLFVLSGHVVGTGSDGEPLLRVDAAEPLPGFTADDLCIGVPERDMAAR